LKTDTILPEMLFEEYSYFNYKFPEPQYLGAKHTHLSWIKKFIPDNITSVIDAFGGSQSAWEDRNYQSYATCLFIIRE